MNSLDVGSSKKERQVTNEINFAGKVVLITGGAGSIAYETASLLQSQGARVFLTDVNKEALAHRVAELDATNETVGFMPADICSSLAVSNVVDECVRRFGGIDCLVNSAGVFPQVPISEMTDDQWRLVHAINLDGTFFMCRAAIPLMRANGSIVNLTSIAAHCGSSGHAHYASSKAAVLGFSKSLAQEVAPRLRVNCVSPGPVDTPMIRELWDRAEERILGATPLRRICRADEVAKAIAFLSSDWASFITAETLHVNGGYYISG